MFIQNLRFRFHLPNRRQFRAGLLLSFARLAVIAAVAAPAFSGSDSVEARDQLYEFHINAGPLEDVIAQFSRQTHTSVLYDAGLLKNRNAQAVDGLFSYPSALEALLVATGIGARNVDDKSFVLVETKNAVTSNVEDAPTREASLTLGTLHVDGPEDFSFYSSILAADLQQALCKRSGLRFVTLLVRANLWVDRFGRVEHAELSRSTGDRARDERLVQVLNEFSVSKPPPAGLPQPVLVSIDFRRI